MQFNKVEICGVNTAKLKTLKESEKRELMAKAQQGDKRSRDALINGNLRLVLSVIQRFSNRNESMDDLFQVGCIGLMKAIDNFDLSQSVRFSTYAVPMIIGEVRRYLRDNNPVRVSRSMRDTAYHALQAKEELIHDNGREPTIKEIAEKMNRRQEEIVIALEAIVDPVSLYEPVYNDGGDTIFVMDQIGESETDESWVDEILLRQSIDGLSQREKHILSLRFMRGLTQIEVAQEVGISQAQVSRLEKGALKKIRNYE